MTLDQWINLASPLAVVLAIVTLFIREKRTRDSDLAAVAKETAKETSAELKNALSSLDRSYGNEFFNKSEGVAMSVKMGHIESDVAEIKRDVKDVARKVYSLTTIVQSEKG